MQTAPNAPIEAVVDRLLREGHTMAYALAHAQDAAVNVESREDVA